MLKSTKLSNTQDIKNFHDICFEKLLKALQTGSRDDIRDAACLEAKLPGDVHGARAQISLETYGGDHPRYPQDFRFKLLLNRYGLDDSKVQQLVDAIYNSPLKAQITHINLSNEKIDLIKIWNRNTHRCRSPIEYKNNHITDLNVGHLPRILFNLNGLDLKTFNSQPFYAEVLQYRTLNFLFFKKTIPERSAHLRQDTIDNRLKSINQQIGSSDDLASEDNTSTDLILKNEKTPLIPKP